MKVLHSICQQLWQTQQWPQGLKRSVFIPIWKKSNAKECSDYHTIVLISQASKVMLKILPARLQQYANYELPDIQAEFRKAKEPEIKPRSPALQADTSPAEPQGKPNNTGVGSLSLLQRIFPTQESNQVPHQAPTQMSSILL